MSDALKEDRVEIDGLYDSTELVYTFWDLGLHDETVIWFVQFIKDEIRLIDYHSSNGHGIGYYSKEVLNEKPYEYHEHHLPHDVRQRLQAEQVTTRLDILRRLRLKKHEDVYVIASHSIQERIQAVRSILNKCKFDSKCERGVEALNRYHRDVNKAKTTDEELVFLDRPSHDKWSHGADAFGYMDISYRYSSIDGEVIGWTGRKPVVDEDDENSVVNDIGIVDLLEV
jgi:hypothetical protein